MIFFLHRITLLALLLAISSSSTHVSVGRCISGLPAVSVLELCYSSTYVLIRQGLADDLATGHLHLAIREFVSYAKLLGKDARFVSLVNVCIPTELYSASFTVQWSTVSTEALLSDMLMSISNSFYRVSEKNSNGNLPPISSEQDRERIMHWGMIETELRKPMSEINYGLIRYPVSARHAHDENRAAACNMWHKHVANATTREPAEEGVKKILRIVIGLISVGCDEGKSWQLLRHYTALVHLGIRCELVEGAELLVPDSFKNDYRRAALRLMKDAAVERKLEASYTLPDVFFDTTYSSILKRLSTFGSWGQSDTFFSSDLTIKNMVRFVSSSVKEHYKIANELYSKVGGRPVMKTAIKTPLNTTSRTLGKPDCHDSRNRNGNMRCESSEKYCYMYTIENQHKHWYANCCNVLICQNAITILPDMNEFSQCCTDCNQLDCKPTLSQNDALKVPNKYTHENVTVHVYF